MIEIIITVVLIITKCQIRILSIHQIIIRHQNLNHIFNVRITISVVTDVKVIKSINTHLNRRIIVTVMNGIIHNIIG